MPNLNDFLQIAEAAEYLGVCQNTLRNWGYAGKVNEYRHPVNNYRLYKQDELDSLLGQLTQPVRTQSTKTRKAK